MIISSAHRLAVTAAPTFTIPDRSVREDLVEAINAWMFNPAGSNNEAKVEAAAKLLLRVARKLPPESRAAPPILFRGIVLGSDLREQLRQNLLEEKPVVLKFKPRVLTSYTTSSSFAINFSKSFLWTGRHSDPTLVLRKAVPSSQIVLNLPVTARALWASMEKDEREHFASLKDGRVLAWSRKENEVIVRNSPDLLRVHLEEVYLFEGAKGKSIGVNVRRVNQKSSELGPVLEDFKLNVRKIVTDAGLTISNLTVSSEALLSLKPKVFIFLVVRITDALSLVVYSYAQASSKPTLTVEWERLKSIGDGRSQSVSTKTIVDKEPLDLSKRSLSALVARIHSYLQKYSR